MKHVFIIISIILIVGEVFFFKWYSAFSFGITLALVYLIITKSHESFVFREWILLLYSFNYLLSPAITYQLDEDLITYQMKITPADYFSLAVPGFLLFSFGLFVIPTTIFKPVFNDIRKVTITNEVFLTRVTVLGVLCVFISNIFSTEFAFFIYLLSLLRFVGVFALYASNPSKYIYLVVIILGIEIFRGFQNAMFHDSLMWFIFFGLFFIYVNKPKLIYRVFGSLFLFLFVLLIQSFKSDYRERVWAGGEAASVETITSVGSEKMNSEVLLGEDNLRGTLNRGNQAWIFASTVDNMDRTLNFQGMNIVALYFESAILPRFLAPHKITAGNRKIFNEFSGHQIGEGTSMGLGVFADGYIAYGKWGVYSFTFALGLLFALSFSLVQRWSSISPFYILFILPILNYAVRPDCELQTTINHIVKSVLVFGSFVSLTKYRFTLTAISSMKRPFFK